MKNPSDTIDPDVWSTGCMIKEGCQSYPIVVMVYWLSTSFPHPVLVLSTMENPLGTDVKRISLKIQGIILTGYKDASGDFEKYLIP
ncbi:hypothetical protein Tco_0979330 [Tanacetum coccineum]